LLPSHVLSKEQNSIAILERAVEAMADAQDGAVDHDLDMLPQLTGRCIPEGTLELRMALAQTAKHRADGVARLKRQIETDPIATAAPDVRVTQATVSTWTCASPCAKAVSRSTSEGTAWHLSPP
jgi:hypothetical protein